jgi:hypothetical protein
MSYGRQMSHSNPKLSKFLMNEVGSCSYRLRKLLNRLQCPPSRDNNSIPKFTVHKTVYVTLDCLIKSQFITNLTVRTNGHSRLEQVAIGPKDSTSIPSFITHHTYLNASFVIHIANGVNLNVFTSI